MVSGVGVKTRLAVPEDLEQVGKLLPELAGPSYSERFPDNTVTDFLRWKYFTNPAGDAAVGIAVDGGRVVSVAAAVRKRVRIGSEALLAFELGDFITAPDYRRRGFFSSLVEMVCLEAKQRGAAFAYVRPNESSFPILVKGLSFFEAQRIDQRRYIVPSGVLHRKTGVPPSLTRGLGIDWIARRLAVPAGSDSVAVMPVSRFSEDMDEFWMTVREQYRFAVQRDRRYLNWRFVDCPTPYRSWTAHREGRVAGYVTVFASRGEATGLIVDLLTAAGDDEAAKSLLRAGMDWLLAAGAQSILTWTLQSGAESVGARLLARACPIADSQHLHAAMKLLAGPIDTPCLPSDGWHLTLGDFDGV